MNEYKKGEGILTPSPHLAKKRNLLVLPQLLVNGIVLGSGFALISIGHTIIFGLMRISNFAHGELYMLGAYFTFTFVDILNMPFWIGLPLAMLGGVLLGWSLNRFIFRYVRDDMTVNGLVTVGLSIFLINISRYIWGAEPRSITNPFPRIPIFIGSITVTPVRLFIIIASLAAIVIFNYIVKYTRIG